MGQAGLQQIGRGSGARSRSIRRPEPEISQSPAKRSRLETPAGGYKLGKSGESEASPAAGASDVDPRDSGRADRDELHYPMRPDRHRVHCCTAGRDRPASVLADTRSDECDLLRASRPLYLAHAAGAFPAAPDGISLVHPLSRRRNLGEAEPSPGDAGPRAVGRGASPSVPIVDSQSVKTGADRDRSE